MATVGLAMLVKHEAQTLPETLPAILPAIDACGYGQQIRGYPSPVHPF